MNIFFGMQLLYAPFRYLAKQNYTMTDSDFVLIIVGFVVFIACAAIGIYPHFRAEKGKGRAIGYKTGGCSRNGQWYTFEAEDGKKYSAHLSSAGARVKGFLDLQYPDEVQVRYDEKNPRNNIVVKKIWKNDT